MFNIGVGEKTHVRAAELQLDRAQPRHRRARPSQILGSLDANGKVFVVNRDGIIFGAGAVINTAGFLATTSDITNEDFMAGRFNFQIPGRPDASIVNMGTITATSGGFAALVAPGVRNSGTITATLGTVALGAGNTFNLDFYGDKLITLGVGDQIAAPGEGRRDRADAEIARHQRGQAQGQWRARRTDRRRRAPGGRFGHQHLGRDRGEFGRHARTARSCSAPRRGSPACRSRP